MDTGSIGGILILVVGGLAAGVSAGIFGVGGGVVIVPFLMLVLGYNQHQANGTSLVALLAPVGILGVLTYYRAGRIGPPELKSGALLALGLFIGAYFGAKIANSLSEVMLRRVFAGFLLVVAAKLWWQK